MDNVMCQTRLAICMGRGSPIERRGGDIEQWLLAREALTTPSDETPAVKVSVPRRRKPSKSKVQKSARRNNRKR